MSDSVQPHRRKPTRLLCPWDSPGKNTGVGCHFLLQCMKVKSESELAQSCPTQRLQGLQPTRLLRPWDSPGKSTRVGAIAFSEFNALQNNNTEVSMLQWFSTGGNSTSQRSFGNLEKERYKHLNAEFQRIARRDKKAFFSNQCKEIEGKQRNGKD